MYQLLRNIYKAQKQTFFFRLFEKYKDKYNNWYWSERVVKNHLARKADVGKYYVIRRYASNMGIGSYILSNLSHIRYALENGYIPVIDMLHYNSTPVDDREMNTWELFFDQPFGVKLDGVFRSREYILSEGVPQKDIPNDSIEFLNSDDFKYWKSLFKQYIIFNEDMEEYCSGEYEDLLNGKKALGVLCRGTDYVSIKPKGHPVQPDIQQVLTSIEDALNRQKYECIYLATEDKNIRDRIKDKYGEVIIENKRVYKNYEEGYIANTYNGRVNDAYLTSKEYLSSLYLLSRCSGIIAGRTSGLVITLLMKDDDYDYKFFWDLGYY